MRPGAPQKIRRATPRVTSHAQESNRGGVTEGRLGVVIARDALQEGRERPHDNAV